MAKKKIEHPSINKGNALKAHNEELRILNDFERVLNKEITFESLIKARSAYGNNILADMAHGTVNYKEEEEKKYIDGLVNYFINGSPSYTYVKFVGGDKIKPILLVDNNDNSVFVHTAYNKYKYGLLVYFFKNKRVYRFIFSPYVDREYCYMTSFTIIHNESFYNYIEISKPKISKDLKYRRKMPSKFNMITLDNGTQAAIPVIEPEDMMN